MVARRWLACSVGTEKAEDAGLDGEAEVVQGVYIPLVGFTDPFDAEYHDGVLRWWLCVQR